MNLFIKQKDTHKLQKQIYGYQREKLGGGYISSLELTFIHYCIQNT